jgi:hypothetical protein
MMAAPKPQVIDTVPEQKKISKESQRARSEQVARDIESDNAHITEKMRQKEAKNYKGWMYSAPFFTYLLFDVSESHGYDYLSPDIVITPAIRVNWAGRCIRHYNRSSSGAYFYINR